MGLDFICKSSPCFIADPEESFDVFLTLPLEVLMTKFPLLGDLDIEYIKYLSYIIREWAVVIHNHFHFNGI